MNERDPLATLFGNASRVKLLRLFLFNPNLVVGFDEILRRSRLVRRTARTELNTLERAGVVRRKQVYEEIPGRSKKRRVLGYTLNEKFPLLQSLQSFMFDTAPLDSKTVLRHLRKAGKLDMVVVAGVFMREFDKRLDLIVASSKLSQNRIEAAVRTLEAEIGIEIRFAAFETEDFLYRLGMYDKLTRDVFDYPHQILVDRVGVHNRFAQQT